MRHSGWRAAWLVALVGLAVACAAGAAARAPGAADASADRWVARSLRGMSLDEKIGQLVVSSFNAVYIGSDTDEFARLERLVRDRQISGLLVFGGRQPAPDVLLNDAYSRVIPGQPLAAASLIDRLQRLARWPLLNSGDFEAGVGFRLGGATVFPRAMAFGAAGDERLVFEAARATALEGRALGMHLNFAPVADLNNNPRNPVINTRSFGEDPAAVERLVAAYVRGTQAGGMLATLKHFPGHGDTDVDTHLGLATILHPRERLASLEWRPFRAGIAAGADAVMTSHIELPALDPAPSTPATFSRPIAHDLLRRELGFEGLVVTDSMSMRAVGEMAEPGLAAVRALQAGHDLVLHSPDDDRALDGIKEAVLAGELPEEQIDASVERVLAQKARLGLHEARGVDLVAAPAMVGRRAHQALAEQVSQRALTLLKDDGGTVPLRLPRDARILYLSILDYPSGWGMGAPSRTFIPELRERWPDVTAVELSDETAASELDLIRSGVDGYDAVIAGIFVRTASYSGRMDLAPGLVSLLRALASRTAARRQPFVTVIFGNPYVATALADLPSLLLTFDYYDLPERSAVRALAGEAPIGGKLPVSLPGVAPLGFGLERAGSARP